MAKTSGNDEEKAKDSMTTGNLLKEGGMNPKEELLVYNRSGTGIPAPREWQERN